MPRSKFERGSAPIELALGVAVILLPAALMVLSFGPWLESRAFVRTAAAAVSRQVVVHGSEEGLAESLRTMAKNAGIDPEVVTVAMCGGVPAPVGAGLTSTCMPLARGGVVTVTVATQVPVVSGPWGAVGGLAVSAEHSEFVDLYRALP